MTSDQFFQLWINQADQVADRFYPKNDTAADGGDPSGRRGEFLRDQGVLYGRILDALQDEGIIER